MGPSDLGQLDNHHGGSFKRINRAKNDPAIPLLGIYLDKAMIQKGTHTAVVIAAVFTIARTWKPPRCPSSVD